MNNEIFISLFSFAHRSPFIDGLIVFMANGFGYLMIMVAILFLYIHTDSPFVCTRPFSGFTRRAKEVLRVLASGGIAWASASILKEFIVTPRPFVLFPEITPLFIHGGMDSFPSGHATFFFALATALFLSHRRVGILYYGVALVVCFGRVASGVHFPVDILGGALLGIGIALCVDIFLRRFKA